MGKNEAKPLLAQKYEHKTILARKLTQHPPPTPTSLISALPSTTLAYQMSK